MPMIRCFVHDLTYDGDDHVLCPLCESTNDEIEEHSVRARFGRSLALQVETDDASDARLAVRNSRRNRQTDC